MGGANATACEENIESGPTFGDGLDDVILNVWNDAHFEQPDALGIQSARQNLCVGILCAAGEYFVAYDEQAGVFLKHESRPDSLMDQT
ncbi:hypothetical protein AA3271_0197 [Gluconobacter japonicus NBRC 3271]|nr:hypothetical protein AA3271_0197 [Gluconobacter japonicus NBRC 3271]